MIEWLRGRLKCVVGKHERSFDAVRVAGDTYESECRYCGKPMLRLAKRKWIVKPTKAG